MALQTHCIDSQGRPLHLAQTGLFYSPPILLSAGGFLYLAEHGELSSMAVEGDRAEVGELFEPRSVKHQYRMSMKCAHRVYIEAAIARSATQSSL